MIIIGCDFHPSGQQAFAVDSETGEILVDDWIEHGDKRVEQVYGLFPRGSREGMEASGNTEKRSGKHSLLCNRILVS